MNAKSPIPPGARRTGKSLFVWASIAFVAVLWACAVIALLQWTKHHVIPALFGAGGVPGIRSRTVQPDATRPGRVAGAPLGMLDFATSNSVSIRLGQERPEDGLWHLHQVSDGRTTIVGLDGVRCRYLNLTRENRTHGYLYFAIDPTFKRDGLPAACIEVEYFAQQPAYFRLQYDAIEGARHQPFKAGVSSGGDIVTWGPGNQTTRIWASNVWQTAAFHVRDGAFLNSQNDGADFRFEVTPAELHVRRVTVTREGGEPPQP